MFGFQGTERTLVGGGIPRSNKNGGVEYEVTVTSSPHINQSLKDKRLHSLEPWTETQGQAFESGIERIFSW